MYVPYNETIRYIINKVEKDLGNKYYMYGVKIIPVRADKYNFLSLEIDILVKKTYGNNHECRFRLCNICTEFELNDISEGIILFVNKDKCPQIYFTGLVA